MPFDSSSETGEFPGETETPLSCRHYVFDKSITESGKIGSSG